MKSADKLRIMVIDGDARQALPFYRSMRQAGHHVTIFCNTRLSPGYLSRYPNNRAMMPCLCERDPETFLAAMLSHLQTGRYDVILPFGHHTMIFCVKHREALEQYAVLPAPPTEIFDLAQDKAQTMAFCMDHNIPCPMTYFPDREDVESIISRAAFPLWMKPRVSVGAIGGRRLNTPDEVRRLVPAFQQRYGGMILQEFVPHEGSEQMVYHTFLDAQGRTCAGMLSKKPRFFPLRGGTSTCLVSVHRPEIIAYCRRLFEGIGYRGIADIDLIVDPRDGQAKVMEINPRVSCSIKIGFAAGIDYADMWLRLATGRSIVPKLDYPAGLCLRNLCQDILWYVSSDRQARKTTSPPWFRLIGREVYYQTISADDPLTFPGFVLNMLWKYRSKEARASKLGQESDS